MDSLVAGIPTVTMLEEPDGSIYGQGQPVSTTKDGEIVTWKGMGVGKPKGRGLTIS